MSEFVDRGFCVYVHKDAEGIVRYVGSGRDERAKALYANTSRGRSYSEYVIKHGKLSFEILHTNLSKDESIGMEQSLYDTYLPMGNLLNCKRPSKENNIDIEFLLKYVYYCESSPSCLRWNITEIKKTKGQPAGTLSKLDGYWYITIKQKQLKIHRVVAIINGLNVNNKFVDHINRDRSDNRMSNLNVCDPIVNSWNRKISSKNTSGYSGVNWMPKVKSWIARWKEDGIEVSAIFPVAAYKSADDAKLAAIQHRDLMKNKHMPYVADKAVDTTLVYERIIKGRVSNTSGETNIGFRESANAYVVTWRVNGERHTKNFNVSKIGDKELALKLAIEFRNSKGVIHE